MSLQLVFDVWCFAFGLIFLWCPKGWHIVSVSTLSLDKIPGLGVCMDVTLQTHKCSLRLWPCPRAESGSWEQNWMLWLPITGSLSGKGLFSDKGLRSQEWEILVTFYVGWGGQLNESYQCPSRFSEEGCSECGEWMHYPSVSWLARAASCRHSWFWLICLSLLLWITL